MKLNINSKVIESGQHNVKLLIQVIEQHESFRSSVKEPFKQFKASNGFEIISYQHPSCTKNSLWVRGSDRRLDNQIIEKKFEYFIDAKRFDSKIKKAVNEFNKKYDE